MKEKISIIEEEPNMGDIERYFKEENEAYSSENRKKYTDNALRLKLIERWKKIAGYENEKGKKVPGIIEKLQGQDKHKYYEESLTYIEKLVGNPIEHGNQSSLDLINHREYGYNIPEQNRDNDIEEAEYQNRKIKLRKLADFLAEEVYKKRADEFNKPLSISEQENILSHVAVVSREGLIQAENKLKKHDLKDVFKWLDKKIYKSQHEIESCNKKTDKQRIKNCQEDLFRLRRFRHFFLELKKK